MTQWGSVLYPAARVAFRSMRSAYSWCARWYNVGTIGIILILLSLVF